MRLRFIFLVVISLSLISCQERNPSLFDDISGVYFNNLSSTMMLTDSIGVTFVYEKEDYLEVPVKIQLVGRTSSEPRPVEVSVSSDNAVSGTDFLLPDSPVIPAGASQMDYVVTLLRTEALKKMEKRITLTIHPNEYFALPVTEMVNVGDTVSTLTCSICFSDMFTKAPAAWDSNLVGEFSQQKFELICKVLDMDPADFNDNSVITLARLLYISAEMTAYVDGEVEKKNEGKPYDEDAFDPATGQPLKFIK
ncbi:MAG: DUF4843 domain-containing protein [Bacteroidales bacterium]|nr:DUF4843 domain-containing protein [Bacteroidales bacterium]